MAQAELKTAPLKKVAEKVLVDGEEVVKGSNEFLTLTQEFEIGKKYMFELASKNPEREQPVVDMSTKRSVTHKQFKPFQNIVFTSQIVWNGQRRMIRYYDGCDTIFQDKQPKDKDTVDQLIRQSKPRNFLDGKFGCFGDERMLLLYLNICSWNGESLFKTRASDTIFISVNADKKATEETEKLDRIELALQYAREATPTKMLIHANFLGIPTIDYDSDNDLSEKEIRIAYRKEASANAASFIESYGNKTIEIKYYIDKALSSGLISNKFNPNKATWGSNNSEICDISGLKTLEGISQRLFEFSQEAEGEEFLIQLKAISE
jgi:hypothetical protein